MREFVLRVIINAVGIAIVAQLVPGIRLVNDTLGTLLIIGLVFGVVNAIVKPILVLLTCPAVIITLGLFILVINGLMLLLTANLLPDRLVIDGFWPAILGGIVMSIISIVLESVLGVRDDHKRKDKPDVIVINRR
jgi:putative membrane protein